ncbi:hypothetical protein A4X06_0g4015 [Tilletia controversa]|uniref:Uncharacterized protein n=2 Tax=Tilletia TaxID=13289 RepID=A0A8X7MUR3_9BASI|nr:hypothetical protein CF328_g3322 [Tilletia controversa]KAE8204403.1 hypothetical protein CF335_g2669 [Tilletia laevis]KAE8248021.1 hypothetical protein A4X06_0g4015 [Tilletia controversa]KAE8262037.1 hypothetical protein A4X03_0g2769 [Tilletia caries]
MVYPRLLLIGPFLLLATLANSAPLPDPSWSTLSPTSSLEARAPPADPWAATFQSYINRYTRLRDLLVEAQLHDFTSMSTGEMAAYKKLAGETTIAGARIAQIKEIIEKAKRIRL